MKVNSEQREEIRNRFFTLRNKEDLIELINDANVLIDEKASSIKLSTLNYYTNPFLSFKRYKVFQIKKKSGSKRTIHAPVKGLKKIRSEEHTSELQSRGHLVCRLTLEKTKLISVLRLISHNRS